MFTDQLPGGGDPRSDDMLPPCAEALRALLLSADRLRKGLADALEISVLELTALGHVTHQPRISPKQLADALQITTGSATSLLDRLEKVGYVARQRHPTDRRRILIVPTTTGREAMGRIYERFDRAISAAVEPDDQPGATAMLTGLAASLRDAAGEAGGPPSPRSR